MRRPTEFATAQAMCIIDVIADAVGVSRTRLLHGGRHRELAWPRQLAIYLVRAMEGMSLPQIGHVFGGLNHTTVLYACRETWRRFEVEIPGVLHALVDLAELLEPALSDISARRRAAA